MAWCLVKHRDNFTFTFVRSTGVAAFVDMLNHYRCWLLLWRDSSQMRQLGSCHGSCRMSHVCDTRWELVCPRYQLLQVRPTWAHVMYGLTANSRGPRGTAVTAVSILFTPEASSSAHLASPLIQNVTFLFQNWSLSSSSRGLLECDAL
jgi:hypothetical protein